MVFLTVALIIKHANCLHWVSEDGRFILGESPVFPEGFSNGSRYLLPGTDRHFLFCKEPDPRDEVISLPIVTEPDLPDLDVVFDYAEVGLHVPKNRRRVVVFTDHGVSVLETVTAAGVRNARSADKNRAPSQSISINAVRKDPSAVLPEAVSGGWKVPARWIGKFNGVTFTTGTILRK